MAPRNKECLLDDENMQELHVDRSSDDPSDCERDKMMMMMTVILDLQHHRKRKMERLEVSNLGVNIRDYDGDVHDGCIIQ